MKMQFLNILKQMTQTKCLRKVHTLYELQRVFMYILLIKGSVGKKKPQHYSFKQFQDDKL